MQKLSLCMIVRNEAGRLAGCVASAREFVDEVVIADTGSTDGTAELAKGLSDTFVRVAWKDDFSAARNAAIEKASGDWVLVLDADERLCQDRPGALGRAISLPDAIAYRFRLINHLGGNKAVEQYVTRLFRRLPGIVYSGRVHEQVTPAIFSALGSGSWRTADLAGVTIEHDGYDPGSVEQGAKSGRNRRLLEMMVAEDPANAYSLYKLSQELEGTPDGKARLYEAARLVLSLGPELIAAMAFAQELLSKAALEMARDRLLDESTAAARAAVDLFPEHPVARYALAASLMERGRPAEARTELEMAAGLKARPEGFHYDAAAFTLNASRLLAQALLASGDHSRALGHLQGALAEHPDDHGLKRERLKALVLAGRHDEALRSGLELIKHEPDPACLLLMADAVEALGDSERARNWRCAAAARKGPGTKP